MDIIRMRERGVGLAVMVLLVMLAPGAAVCGEFPKQGGVLPELALPAPASEKERAYLDVEPKQPFALRDVSAKLIVLEILGVYCPQCHKQRPHINRLFHRVARDAELSKKVKFLGVAAGATPMEVAYYMKQAKVPYPVAPDETFAIHKRLGEPRTPFTMVVASDGRVLFAQLGIVKDMNAFFSTLKELAGK